MSDIQTQSEVLKKLTADVDQGSTVTDYLKTERERGITIQSACIPLAWKNHRLNLIDTPGHVDFTIEVERALRVLDGAVTILDGVAGVEAQTETVWKQSNTYGVARLLFVNKMDREGANFSKTVTSIRKRLTGWGVPLVCQLPVFKREDGKQSSIDKYGGMFEGVVDVVALKQLDWKKDAKFGAVVTSSDITDPELLHEAKEAREVLIESLSDIDEDIVEVFMECDGEHEKVPESEIKKALRRCTLKGTGVPVLCGASFKNMGVQPVLDAIVDYLPSPKETAVPTAETKSKPVPVKIEDKPLCALAFKVIFDAQRGPLVFVRVYSGRLESRSMLKIASISGEKRQKERATKILEMYADDYEEIPAIEAGNIGVILGLKHVKTGDTLLGAQDPREMQLHNITIPTPVFVRSIEVGSTAEEKELAAALNELLREDPSLSLTTNEETGQTLLSGMGELHLEIAGERLLDTYKVKCRLGKVEISYRETMKDDHLEVSYAYDRDFVGKQLKCDISLAMTKEPGDSFVGYKLPESSIHKGDAPEDVQEVGGAYPTLEEIQHAIREGIQNGLSRGPKLGFPVSQVRVECTSLGLYHSTVSTIGAIRAAAHSATTELLAKSQIQLLHPVMNMRVRVPPQFVGAISRDLSGTRRGVIHSVETDDDRTIVSCAVPLSQLLGYASTLRSLTQGTGEWTMELDGYEPVNQDQEEIVLKSIRGY